jgi:hypothetical protein
MNPISTQRYYEDKRNKANEAAASLKSLYNATTSPLTTDEQSRNGLVKRCLRLTEELEWDTYKRSGFYWFKKGGKCIPIILEDHMKDKKTKKGYLTAAGWKTDSTSMCWLEYTSWTTNMVENYIKWINSLDWVSFGASRTNRKRLDPINMSDEQIKGILKGFESMNK